MLERAAHPIMIPKANGFFVFPGDWTSSAVAACSLEAQGLYFRLLLIMSTNQAAYGTLAGPDGQQMPNESICRRCNATEREFKRAWRELAENGVLSYDARGVLVAEWMQERRAKQLADLERKSRGRPPGIPSGIPTEFQPEIRPLPNQPYPTQKAAAGFSGDESPRRQPPRRGEEPSGDAVGDAKRRDLRAALLAAGVAEPALGELAATALTPKAVQEAANAAKAAGKGAGVLVLDLRAKAEAASVGAAAKAEIEAAQAALAAMDPARRKAMVERVVLMNGWGHITADKLTKWDKFWVQIGKEIGSETAQNRARKQAAE